MTGLRTPVWRTLNLIRIMPAKGSGIMIQIRLNGQEQTFPENFNLERLLSRLKLNPLQVAVAKNLEVVVRSELSSTVLEEGDEIEIFHAVGGG